jgi:hypothetical protein
VVVETGDLEGLRADRATALDHVDFPFEEAELELELDGAEVVELGLLVSLLDESDLVPSVELVDELSAFAAFLYESLR